MADRGKLHSISEEELRSLVKQSSSMAEILRKLDYSKVGSSYRLLRHKLQEFDIDRKGLNRRARKKANAFLKSSQERLPSEDVFKKEGTVSRSTVKRHLKDRVPYECRICGISQWRGQELSLHLDHINGINTDHRIENLRFLCPNCHSQTDTYGGKNLPKSSKKDRKTSTCVECGESASRGATYCLPCWKKNCPTVIDWPAVEILKKRVSDTSYAQVGRDLGVSDNAVRKRIAKYDCVAQ